MISSAKTWSNVHVQNGEGPSNPSPLDIFPYDFICYEIVEEGMVPIYKSSLKIC